MLKPGLLFLGAILLQFAGFAMHANWDVLRSHPDKGALTDLFLVAVVAATFLFGIGFQSVYPPGLAVSFGLGFAASWLTGISLPISVVVTIVGLQLAILMLLLLARDLRCARETEMMIIDP
ncbi:MAG: hypothetical protein EON60_14050 [Alphaproteobacteria bacterium]|nr:MAG: hypothetical protein EON60_14050 [Alphaproteobacteria bacterium]